MCARVLLILLAVNHYVILPFLRQRGGNRVQSVLPLTAAMISSATHTGDNEFELDGVPLGQVRGVRCGKGCVVCMGVGR